MIIIDNPDAPKPQPGNGALFLDRDGVINEDFGHVHRIEDIVFVPGIFDLCRSATAASMSIIVVTNQGGIARGYFSTQAVESLSRWMFARFNDEGCPLTRITACPHHPEFVTAGSPAMCSCRKPEPGMILRAITDYAIDPGASVIIGDNLTDIDAGLRAGIATRLLIDRTGERRPALNATATIVALSDATPLLP